MLIRLCDVDWMNPGGKRAQEGVLGKRSKGLEYGGLVEVEYVKEKGNGGGEGDVRGECAKVRCVVW